MRYPGKRFDEYVVAYDISCDRERSKVDKVLKKYGFRIQKSVFECKLTKTQKEKLIQQLKELNIKTGFIKIYLLTDIVDSQTMGKPPTSIDEFDAFVI